MSVRILPLTVLALLLLVLGWAVAASAQEPLNPIGPREGRPLAQAPFTLTPDEEAHLGNLLTDWQTMSSTVKTFESTFKRWDYDGVFGNGQTPKREVLGTLKYAAPDKGFYALNDESEKWICTGTTVYEFRADLKQVREYAIPKEQQGQAISDGPMPFVFGVEAAKMKARYWMRITTPAEAAAKNQVWLEAYPKEAKDAANFSKVNIILAFVVDEQGKVVKLEPFAINIVLPNEKDRTAYLFTEMKNNTWLNNLGEFFKIFIRPATPLNWQHVVMDEKQGPAAPQAPGAPHPPAAQPAANVGDAPSVVVPR